MMFVLDKTSSEIFRAADIMLIVFEFQNVDVVHSIVLYPEQPHFALRAAEGGTKIS